MGDHVRRLVYLTAGAGGMYCGSCLNDNTLARALVGLGVDVQLIPIYTPIRTDEQDVSAKRVFMGGVNVYLQQRFAVSRFLPAVLDRFLNHPALLRLVTRKDLQADREVLGRMTVSMLKGAAGFQRKEVRRLVGWLARSARPDLVCFSNILIAGCSVELRRRLNVPLVVTLQGDDVFLEFLPPKFRGEAIEQIRDLTSCIDAFIVHSTFYRDLMHHMLGIPRDKFRVVPLGIDVADFLSLPLPESRHGKKTIGYLARLAPEKGLRILTDAFLELRQKRDDVRLRVAGWLGTEHRGFAAEQFGKLEAAGLKSEFDYVGEVSRRDKLAFLRGLDVFTVPTTYREPKGLYMLEAMAAGLPVVAPEHGAFPELLAAAPGGILVRPGDPSHLCHELDRLLSDEELRLALSTAGRRAVLSSRNSELMARETLKVYGGLWKK